MFNCDVYWIGILESKNVSNAATGGCVTYIFTPLAFLIVQIVLGHGIVNVAFAHPAVGKTIDKGSYEAVPQVIF